MSRKKYFSSRKAVKEEEEEKEESLFKADTVKEDPERDRATQV